MINSTAAGAANGVLASFMHVPVFQGEGKIEYLERPVPQIQKADDVLVRIEACGICGTDLNILAMPPAHKAPPGIIIGHEGVGIIETLVRILCGGLARAPGCEVAGHRDPR